MDRICRRATLAFVAVSFVGFVDAAYLTVQHYFGTVVPCALTGGCETVLTSPYAVVGGIPVALTGALYYLALFFGAILYLSNNNRNTACLLSWLTFTGLGVSLYLVYLQVFVIEAICLYCMASAIFSASLFILGRVILKRNVELPAG